MPPRDPVRAWSRTGRAAGYIAGSALLAGTVLFLLDAAGFLGSGPVYRRTGAGPLVDQATFYVAYFGHQHHIVWDIIARDTILPVAYLAPIVVALAVRNRTGPRHPKAIGPAPTENPQVTATRLMKVLDRESGRDLPRRHLARRAASWRTVPAIALRRDTPAPRRNASHQLTGQRPQPPSALPLGD